MILLPEKQYDIIYCDPPWSYPMQQHRGTNRPDTGSAKAHYSTMKLAEMKDINITSIADINCLLFMWTTGPHNEHAIELGNAWGFNYTTVGFVWHKIAHNPGNYTMSFCEFCLIFKKGSIPQPRGERNMEQFIPFKRGIHSAKPNEARRRIELMFPTQSKIELFARKIYQGWDAWGNEINLVDNPDQSDIKPVEQIKLF